MQTSRIIETNTTRSRRSIDPITLDILEARRATRYEMDAVLFHRHVARHPRTARRLPDRGPQGPYGRGSVGSFIGGFLRAYEGDIEAGDIFLVSDPKARGRDQPRQ